MATVAATATTIQKNRLENPPATCRRSAHCQQAPFRHEPFGIHRSHPVAQQIQNPLAVMFMIVSPSATRFSGGFA